MNALRLPGFFDNLGHANVVQTSGGGVFGHLDGPVAGALSLRQSARRLVGWRRSAHLRQGPPRARARLRVLPERRRHAVPELALSLGRHMSAKHPVIAVTGSSGAGTTTVKRSFEHIFHRESIRAAVIEGDSFHRYDRDGMRQAIAESESRGEQPVSHFGPEANLFNELELLFRTYGETGARASDASTCTTKKRRPRAATSRARSPTGRSSPQTATCCSTRASTAA